LKKGILLAKDIKEEIKSKRIIFSGYDKLKIGPNSIDVRLQDTLITYVECVIMELDSGDFALKPKPISKDFFIDPKKDNKTYTYKIPKEGLIIYPNCLYLGSTIEKAGSDYYVPMYEGRSSMARLGIQSHLSAGFGDIGFKDNWTLEIVVIHPVKVYSKMRIGQVYYINGSSRPKKFYDGKYTNQPKAQSSKAYLDFKKEV
jgi:dCTP deaminase